MLFWDVLLNRGNQRRLHSYSLQFSLGLLTLSPSGEDSPLHSVSLVWFSCAADVLGGQFCTQGIFPGETNETFQLWHCHIWNPVGIELYIQGDGWSCSLDIWVKCQSLALPVTVDRPLEGASVLLLWWNRGLPVCTLFLFWKKENHCCLATRKPIMPAPHVSVSNPKWDMEHKVSFWYYLL